MESLLLSSIVLIIRKRVKFNNFNLYLCVITRTIYY